MIKKEGGREWRETKKEETTDDKKGRREGGKEDRKWRG